VRSCHVPAGRPAPARHGREEADLEGLAADDNWLWLVGSHARTRRKAEKEAGETIDLDKLADLKDTRPRCLLARLPAGGDPRKGGGQSRATAAGMRECSSRTSMAMR
jgi:hypothetical protein